MPGTHHIIPIRFRRFPPALCGERLVKDRSDYCNTDIANPTWDYDWCHDCVKPESTVGSYRPVIAGAKLREGTTTILPRGRALQGVGLSSMRFHPIGGGPKTTKMDKKHGSRQESHPLSDRPEIEWPCRT